ncbi:MAG: hypothetical protein ACE5MH_03185, partial [Terriglobia bacterium]
MKLAACILAVTVVAADASELLAQERQSEAPALMLGLAKNQILQGIKGVKLIVEDTGERGRRANLAPQTIADHVTLHLKQRVPEFRVQYRGEPGPAVRIYVNLNLVEIRTVAGARSGYAYNVAIEVWRPVIIPSVSEDVAMSFNIPQLVTSKTATTLATVWEEAIAGF